MKRNIEFDNGNIYLDGKDLDHLKDIGEENSFFFVISDMDGSLRKSGTSKGYSHIIHTIKGQYLVGHSRTVHITEDVVRSIIDKNGGKAVLEIFESDNPTHLKTEYRKKNGLGYLDQAP